MRRAAGFILPGACALLVATACTETFTPLATPSEPLFSIFGYLDAAADTQWIRVTPVRPLVLTAPDSFETTLTLEELGTGRIITFRDSLFALTQYQYPGVGGEGRYVHNYWTTGPIHAGASYRFTMSRGSAEPAEAVVQIPLPYDAEVWLGQPVWEGPNAEDYLRLSGLKHLPFVTATTYFYDGCGSFVVENAFPNRLADGDARLVPVSKAKAANRGECGRPLGLKRVLRAVASEAPWPAGERHSTSALAQWDDSNISHAMGFIGGVLTRLIPYEECLLEVEGPEVLPAHCRLSYDSTKATLRGTARETRCNRGPFDTLLVRLYEIDKQPGAVRKVRTTRTAKSGDFEIAALDPGIRYLLSPVSPTRRLSERDVI